MKSFLQYLSEAKSFQPNKDDELEMKLYNKLANDYKYADVILRWFHTARKAGADTEWKELLNQTRNVMDELSQYDDFVKRYQKRMPKEVGIQASDGNVRKVSSGDLSKLRSISGFRKMFKALRAAVVSASSDSALDTQFKVLPDEFGDIGVECFNKEAVCWFTRGFETTRKFIAKFWNITDEKKFDRDDYYDPEINSPYCTRQANHWKSYSEGNPQYTQYWIFKAVPDVAYAKGDLSDQTVMEAFNSSFDRGPSDLVCMFDSNNDWCDRNDLAINDQFDVDSIDDILEIVANSGGYVQVEDDYSDFLGDRSEFVECDFNGCEDAVVDLIQSNFKAVKMLQYEWSKNVSYGIRPDDGRYPDNTVINTDVGLYSGNMILDKKDFDPDGNVVFRMPLAIRGTFHVKEAPENANLGRLESVSDGIVIFENCKTTSFASNLKYGTDVTLVFRKCGDISAAKDIQVIAGYEFNSMEPSAVTGLHGRCTHINFGETTPFEDLTAFANVKYSKLFMHASDKFVNMKGCPSELDSISANFKSNSNALGGCVMEFGPKSVSDMMSIEFEAISSFDFMNFLPGKLGNPRVCRLDIDLNSRSRYDHIVTLFNIATRQYINDCKAGENGYYDSSENFAAKLTAGEYPFIVKNCYTGKNGYVTAVWHQLGLYFFNSITGDRLTPNVIDVRLDVPTGAGSRVCLTGIPQKVKSVSVPSTCTEITGDFKSDIEELLIDNSSLDLSPFRKCKVNKVCIETGKIKNLDIKAAHTGPFRPETVIKFGQSGINGRCDLGDAGSVCKSLRISGIISYSRDSQLPLVSKAPDCFILQLPGQFVDMSLLPADLKKLRFEAIDYYSAFDYTKNKYDKLGVKFKDWNDELICDLYLTGIGAGTDIGIEDEHAPPRFQNAVKRLKERRNTEFEKWFINGRYAPLDQILAQQENEKLAESMYRLF